MHHPQNEKTGIDPAPSPAPTRGGESLLTAFCYNAELDELIPYEICTANTRPRSQECTSHRGVSSEKCPSNAETPQCAQEV